LLDDHFMHVCFDAFYQMLPAHFKPLTADDSRYVEKVHLGFEYAIPALARAGNRSIVVAVDTHQLSAIQAAQKVISALETVVAPTAFDHLSSRATALPERNEVRPGGTTYTFE
jgi:hypothetical protein